MKLHRIPLLLVMFLVCLASSTRAQEGRKPPREEEPISLTAAQQAALLDAWKNQKRPSISLFVGYYGLKGPEFRGSSIERQLQSSIEGMITSAGVNSAIVLPDRDKLRDDQHLGAIDGNKSDEVHKTVATLLARQDGSVRLGLVVLLQSSGNGRTTVSWQLRRFSPDRLMAGDQFDEVNENNPSIVEVKKFSTAIVVRIIDALQKDTVQAEEGRPVTLRILGLRGNEQADDVAVLLEKLPGAADVQHHADRQGRTTFAEFQLYYKGDTKQLVKELRTSLLSAGQSLRQIQTREGNVLAEVLSTVRPGWCLLTDMDGAGAAARDARTLALRGAGAPRMAVVVGNDLADPVAEFANRDLEKQIGAVAFDRSALADQIGDWMGRLGFDVRNADDLRERIRDRVREGNRFAGADALADALRSELPGFDCVVYVNTSADYHGTGYRYSAQMIHWKDGALVGAQRWPDPGFDAFDACSIDPGDINDVARYLVGNLAERWDRFASRQEDRRTLQVTVKELSDASQLAQLVDLFRAIPQVNPDGVDRMVISGSLGGFDVGYRGRPGPVVDEFRKRLGELSFPLRIEGQSQLELVINLGARPPAILEAPGREEAKEGEEKEVLSRVGKAQKNVHALLIGINYQGDPAGIAPLRFCVRDAQLMKKTIVEKCGVPLDRVIMMTDDLPETSEYFPCGPKIKAQVESLKNRVRAGDRVVIFFSGHGSTPVDKAGNAIIDDPALTTRSTSIEGRRVVVETKLREIRDTLRAAQASEVILLIDACHSGGLGVGLEGGRPPASLDAVFAALAANNQSMITLAGSRLSQFSLEWPERGQGYFSYYIAEGLSGKADTQCGGNRDGKVTFSELYDFAFQRVNEATKGNQQPFMSATVIESPVLADYSK